MSDEATVPEWATDLPEAMHNLPHLKASESMEGFINSVTNDASYRGNSIRIPGEDASESDVAEYRAKLQAGDTNLMATPNRENADEMAATMGFLGMPEKAEDYKAPKDMEIDGEVLGKLKGEAHKMQMTQGQFEAQLTIMSENSSTAKEAAKQAMATDVATLETEWGATYSERMKEVGDFLAKDKSAPAEIVEAFKSKSLNATSIKWLHNMAMLGDESTEGSDQSGNSSGNVTPEEARSQVQEIFGKLATLSPSSDEYRVLNAKRVELTRMGMTA